MPRIKGEGGAARSVGAKAPRKALGGGGGVSAATRAITATSEGKRGGGGGAAYNPLGQPVPDSNRITRRTARMKRRIRPRRSNNSCSLACYISL